NIGGQKEPLFVVAIDAHKNQVILGPRSALSCLEVSAVDLNLMVSESSPLLKGTLDAHIRLGHKGAPAKILDLEPGRIRVQFEEPQFAAAPGQVLVLYSGEGVVASAIIDK
ncbi:MAG: tRNA 2-thiouridine(34) synthase MnmA, partial [Fibrobacter sp.]|nr:tRNA 2-thiouridine(34) synthase MnmA [Fibrobacter sp.]